jgi:hypothetical protein
MAAVYGKIQELAYRLWQDDGAPEGRAMDYWLQAEAALTAIAVAVEPKAPAKPKAEVKPKAEPKPKAPAKPKAEAKPKAAAKPKSVKA